MIISAPVDPVLDPATHRLERGRGQGGGGHGQTAGPLGQAGGGREDEQVGHHQQGSAAPPPRSPRAGTTTSGRSRPWWPRAGAQTHQGPIAAARPPRWLPRSASGGRAAARRAAAGLAGSRPTRWRAPRRAARRWPGAGRPGAAGGRSGPAGRARAPRGQSGPRPPRRPRTASRSGWPPPQTQDQPDGGVSEQEDQREGVVGQHAEGERPGHRQGHDQAGRAAAEGRQPQRPGKRGPVPGVQLHRVVLDAVRLAWVMLAGQR
jgi:hypothetical protein